MHRCNLYDSVIEYVICCLIIFSAVSLALSSTKPEEQSEKMNNIQPLLHLLDAGEAVFQLGKKPRAMRVEENRALARSIKNTSEYNRDKPVSLKKSRRYFLCQKTLRV